MEENGMDKIDAKILIAEDEETNFLYLEELLYDICPSVVRAKNGQEAVDMVMADSEISIVLMDIKMPVMNGYEATKLIKKERPNLPVIAQTAFAMIEDEKKAFENGCDGYLSKPIRQEDLFKVIEKFAGAGK